MQASRAIERRHIFIYNHVRTNQVIYSLSRKLNVSLYPSTISRSALHSIFSVYQRLLTRLTFSIAHIRISTSSSSHLSASSPSRRRIDATNGSRLRASSSHPITRLSMLFASCVSSGSYTNIAGARNMGSARRSQQSASGRGCSRTRRQTASRT